MARPDSTWLTLRAGLRDLLLQEHHRPWSFFNSLLFPDEQTPQMITFIGHRTKTLAMRKLRLGARVQENINGEIHLQSDPDSFKDDSPLLFADCELHNISTYQKSGAERSRANTTARPLTWHRGISQSLDPATLAHTVYSKLIAPFSTVICIFAEDFAGLGAVAELLALWLLSFSNRPSDLPTNTYPRVLILTGSQDATPFDEHKATKAFMLRLGREAEKKHGILTGITHGRLKKTELDQLLLAQFGGMRVLNLPPLQTTVRSWKSLKSRILQDSEELQVRRIGAKVAFSATHFQAFFQLASDHFCSDIISPFSFVRASRVRNPVPLELSLHVANFLKQVEAGQMLNFAVPVIASALMFDCYPAGMHGFHPSFTFKQFFYQLCVWIDPYKNSSSAPGQSSPQFLNAVEVAFSQFALEVINFGKDEVAVHLRVLSRFQNVWKNMHSNVDCFACLARTPENTLSCRHALCDHCIVAHGNACNGEPWTFWLKHCPLCGESNERKFDLKPDTAGVRVIIAEGGGIRGVVPLSFLKELENAVGLPMNIQEHCDIAVGSSSGSLVVLGLVSNSWPVEECLSQFQNLSTLAFCKRTYFGIPLFSLGGFRRVMEVILSFATDSRYSSTGITKALISAFGENSSLFEISGGGTKVAVVATTTDDTSTCIFTNYNGPERRSQDCGYKLIRPDDIGSELSVWQAARASSAAPPYFKSFQGYQDGGLGGHNNPINLALWEQDTIWSRQKKQPDIVLSLGTGFRRGCDVEAGVAEKSSFLRKRCVPRLFRSFLNFFVGETRWRELQNGLQPQFRDRYHRMNIEFYGDEPELDDLQAMPNLRQQARFQALSNNDVQNCADNLLAALFYLELVELPVFDRDLYSCKGRILCRIGPSSRALRALASRLNDTRSHFYLDFDQKVPCVDEVSYNLVDCGAAFCRNVFFKIRSLEDSIDIKIDGLTRRARSISNCPYKINTLIQDQGLDYVFGSRKGRKRTRPVRASIVLQLPKRVKFAHSHE